jgi:hypothetical protein
VNLLQYIFVLDSGFDMDAVRARVAEKRHVVDDLPGLRWKAWLLSEPLAGHVQLKTYAPLYLFDSGEAAAAFLAGPIFRGVTDRFGWTRPHAGLPLGLQDAGLSQARSATLSTAPLQDHEALVAAAQAPLALAEGEVGRVRMLHTATMQLRTFRFWRLPPQAHPAVGEQTLYEVAALSRPA